MSPTIEHLTLSDGYRAAVRWWRPPNPRGAVLYFHGIQSHGGWYEQSGAALAARGYTVLMPDRRGSGLNASQRGHVDSLDRALADAADAMDALLADVRPTTRGASHLTGEASCGTGHLTGETASGVSHPTDEPSCGTGHPTSEAASGTGHPTSETDCGTGHPTGELSKGSGPSAHVVGVSWGGKLAVCLASHRPQQVASLSLVAPGLFPRVDLTTAQKFRVGVALINDRDRLFPIPLNDPAYFTENPERVRFVENDKLLLTHVTAPFLLVTRRMDRIVRRLGESTYRGPIHLMLAGRERIIDNERTRAWLRDLPSPDRRITDYPDGCHTLEFDTDPQAFLEDLVGWVERRRVEFDE